MKPNAKIAIFLSCLFTLLPACSAMQAQRQIDQRSKEIQLNNEAWQSARVRLNGMCPQPPKSLLEYNKGRALRDEGHDPFNGCDVRWVKVGNGVQVNDWQWVWFPSYQTIVKVHDEELRKRVTPKLYEEYMLGLSYFLAEKMDNGEITPKQLMVGFAEGWNWLNGKMQEEKILFQQNLQAAQQADAAAWNTLNTIAAGLATVATAALVASAAVNASRPAPANCYAYPMGGGNYSVQCY